MTRYTLEEFKKLVNKADLIYGTVSLNAAVAVPARLRKKMLLASLNKIDNKKNSLGYYGRSEKDDKGRRILILM